MRSPAAQKHQNRRREVNRVARKRAREAAQLKRKQFPGKPRSAVTGNQPTVQERRSAHETARVSARLRDLCPEVKRRFIRVLYGLGKRVDAQVFKDRIEVHVTPNLFYTVVVNPFGRPDPGIVRSTRQSETERFIVEPATDWATFDADEAFRAALKFELATGRAST